MDLSGDTLKGVCRSGWETRQGGDPPLTDFKSSLKLNSELSFIGKDLGFVQTRDQELSIALFKSIKVQLPRKLELVYIFWNQKNVQILGGNRSYLFITIITTVTDPF